MRLESRLESSHESRVNTSVNCFHDRNTNTQGMFLISIIHLIVPLLSHLTTLHTTHIQTQHIHTFFPELIAADDLIKKWNRFGRPQPHNALHQTTPRWAVTHTGKLAHTTHHNICIASIVIHTFSWLVSPHSQFRFTLLTLIITLNPLYLKPQTESSPHCEVPKGDRCCARAWWGILFWTITLTLKPSLACAYIVSPKGTDQLFPVYSHKVLQRWVCYRSSTEALTLTPSPNLLLVARTRKPFSTVHNLFHPNARGQSAQTHILIARGQPEQFTPEIFSHSPFYSYLLLWGWGCTRLFTETICPWLVARYISNLIPPFLI